MNDSWITYRTRFLVRARQLTEPLVFVDSFGREQSGGPGDYLVETSEGIRRIASRTLFEDIYVPLAPAQPASVSSVQKPPLSVGLDHSSVRESVRGATRATA